LVLSDDDRLKILSWLLRDFNIPKVLEVTVSTEPIKKDQRSGHAEPLFEYSIPGSAFKHKSRTSNLSLKLE
jgi:hypothetical protein